MASVGRTNGETSTRLWSRRSECRRLDGEIEVRQLKRQREREKGPTRAPGALGALKVSSRMGATERQSYMNTSGDN